MEGDARTGAGVDERRARQSTLPNRVARPGDAAGTRQAYSRPMTTRPIAIAAFPCPDAERVLPGFQFADAYKVPAPRGMDAIEATRLAFSRGPGWIRSLLG